MSKPQEQFQCVLRFGFSYDDPESIETEEQKYLYEKLCGYGRTLNPSYDDYNECGLSLDSEVALQTCTHHTDLNKALDHFAVICKRVARLSNHAFSAEVYTYIYEHTDAPMADPGYDYAVYSFEQNAFVLDETGEIIELDRIEVISGWV